MVPADFTLALDARFEGRTLLGGEPFAIVHLGEAATARIRAWVEGAPVGDGGALARALVAANLAQPVPPAAAGALPPVTVVIPVRDRSVARLLAALAQVGEVIVVDDASGDGGAALRAEAEAFGARYLRREVRGGAGAARNDGLAAATHELVACVDSDCVPVRGWLEALLPHFADPEVGAVAPRIVALEDESRVGRVEPDGADARGAGASESTVAARGLVAREGAPVRGRRESLRRSFAAAEVGAAASRFAGWRRERRVGRVEPDGADARGADASGPIAALGDERRVGRVESDGVDARDAGATAGDAGATAGDAAAGARAPRAAGPPKRARAHASRALRAYERDRSPLDRGPAPARVVPYGRVPFVPGAAIVLRRHLRFDPGLKGGEDVELCWRVPYVRYEPAAQVAHAHRTDPRAWVARRVYYGRTAAGIATRHPGQARPLNVSPWTTAAYAALAARRPRLAAAVLAAATALAARELRGAVADPVRTSLQLAALGSLRSGRVVADALTRAWWPLSLAAALAVPKARAPLVAALLTQTPLHLADDLAYGLGLWHGCLRQRTLDPLLPARPWRLTHTHLD